MRTILLSLVLIGFVAATSVSFQGLASDSTMLAVTEAFLETLEPEQIEQVTFPFDGEERLDWHFIPRERLGLSLKAMTPAQRKASLELVRAGLSEQGYSKAETIRKLETVLFEMSGEAHRDPELYFFMIFGEPSEHGTWGWRYEGHHVSQNWTIVNGRALATTPHFFGANPAEVRQGSMKGTRALAAEEDLARALLKSLTPEQRAKAILDETAPRDILTSAERQAAMQEDTGLAYGEMRESQQVQLWAIIELYAHAQPLAIAEARLEKVRRAGLDRIKFAWMGGAEKGDGHYYRIQGSTFLIEYDNTQNDANHIHSVWRDFKGDFGRDLLAAHYQAYPHRTANAEE
jgi:hypothetical protein